MSEDTHDSGSDESRAAELAPILGELVSGALRRLIEGGRTGLRTAAASGRRRLEQRQLERDLEHFWMRLGKTTYHLVEAGEIEHPALRKAMERIDELEARIAEARAASEDDVAPHEGPR